MECVFAGVAEQLRVSSLSCMQDEELVLLSQSGHKPATEFLIERFRSLVESKAKTYYVIGADRDDVIQEGMIGLCKAIRDFRYDKVHRFRTFADLCVTRQIITAVKSATRQKHSPMNAYVSLNRATPGEVCDSTLLESLPSSGSGMYLGGVITDTFMHQLPKSVIDALSTLEKGVLRCYLEGKSYREMSLELSCQPKSIDNALQRVKRKIGTILKDGSA